MKNFFDSTHLFKVFLIMFTIITLLFGILFYALPLRNMDKDLFLEVSAVLGFVFGCMSTLTISMMRKSDLFWEAARKLSKEVDETESLELLKILWNTNLKELHKKAQGKIHYVECNRIATIMNTKAKYLK